MLLPALQHVLQHQQLSLAGRLAAVTSSLLQAQAMQQGGLGCAAGTATDHHATAWPAQLQAPAAWQQQQQLRHKHTVRMVLLKDHEHLGRVGDLVRVKAGHARYTLFPSGAADYAIPSVLRVLRARGFLSELALQQLRARGRAAEGKSSAAQADPSTLPLEQQLPQVLQLLASKTVVVSRRFNHKLPEQPLLDHVTARQLAAHVAQQLRVDLAPGLVLLPDPIREYGSFKVPLALQDAEGRQLELSVDVRKTYRGSRLGRLRRAMAAPQQQQQQQAASPQAQQPPSRITSSSSSA